MGEFQPEPWISDVDQEKPSGQPKSITASAHKPESPHNLPVEDLLRKLRAEMGLPRPSREEMTAAVQAVQQMALQMDAGESVSAVAEAQERHVCHACGNHNPRENHFCARCGVPLQDVPEGEAPPPTAVRLVNPLTPASGQHHYHHHYHHHYFSSSSVDGAASGAAAEPRAVNSVPAARDAARARPSAGGAGLSRAETAVRRLTQDWALACNTKHLDDLVDLYAADAIVLRSNVPPVRSTAAIRELLFTLLEAGLGEVQMEPMRVEIFGDFAYEVGRCTMLAPSGTGKRREERGKYVILAGRQAGEWKILVDCWSNDLSLESAQMASRPSSKSA